MNFEADRPVFENMTKEELIAILDSFRSSLVNCEDAGGFCLYVGKRLKVSCESGAYDDE